MWEWRNWSTRLVEAQEVPVRFRTPTRKIKYALVAQLVAQLTFNQWGPLWRCRFESCREHEYSRGAIGSAGGSYPSGCGFDSHREYKKYSRGAIGSAMDFCSIGCGFDSHRGYKFAPIVQLNRT